MPLPDVIAPDSIAVLEELASCTLCSGVLCSTRQHDIVRCAECGIYLRSPRRTQDEIRRIYDAGAMYATWREEWPAREPLWRKRLRIVQRHARGRRLLDVGTGDGAFLRVASEAGFLAKGTELSQTGATLARAAGHSVREGQLPELDFGDTRFDVVTLWHVLEHVPDPGRVLARARDLLDDAGTIVIAVPNETGAQLRERSGLSRLPFGDLPPQAEQHLTYFDPWTLRRALRRFGFTVLEFGVDDVELEPTLLTRSRDRLQALLAATTGWHAARAMFAVARKGHGPFNSRTSDDETPPVR